MIEKFPDFMGVEVRNDLFIYSNHMFVGMLCLLAVAKFSWQVLTEIKRALFMSHDVSFLLNPTRQWNA